MNRRIDVGFTKESTSGSAIAPELRHTRFIKQKTSLKEYIDQLMFKWIEKYLLRHGYSEINMDIYSVDGSRTISKVGFTKEVER